MKNKINKVSKWFYYFTLAVAVIIVYKLFDNLKDISSWINGLLGVLTPFISGILISYILYVPCRKLETLISKIKKPKLINKWARGISVILVYIVAILLIVLLVKVIIPPITESITDFANNFQSYYSIVEDKINSLPEDSILKREEVTNYMEKIQSINIGEIISADKIFDYLKEIISFAGNIFDIFVSIIVSAYILIERKEIIRFFDRLTSSIFKKETYESINKNFNRSNQIFFNFLASQVLDAIIVGIITSIAMSIMGVKYSVLLGFMIGLFNLIPYFGAIVAVTLAGIITLLTGGVGQAIWMLVVVTILQQIDANIINPKIVGSSLKISPLLVIFGVTIGGAYFGFIGMFIAVPVIAVLKLILEDYMELKEKKQAEEIKLSLEEEKIEAENKK